MLIFSFFTVFLVPLRTKKFPILINTNIFQYSIEKKFQKKWITNQNQTNNDSRGTRNKEKIR